MLLGQVQNSQRDGATGARGKREGARDRAL